MKIGTLVLLGASVLGASYAAEAATLAPRLEARGAATLTATASEKKAHHVKAQKKTASHKIKKVKKVKKA